jgi:hypothetical protein
MSTLTWIKSTQNEWLFFESFSDLADIKTAGVYIIWHGGQNPRVVYVGKGDICARLTAHRNDKTITAYNQSGPLFVTWAAVPAAQQDGVERFLADRLKPLIGDRHPDVAPIPVTLPWAA